MATSTSYTTINNSYNEYIYYIKIAGSWYSLYINYAMIAKNRSFAVGGDFGTNGSCGAYVVYGDYLDQVQIRTYLNGVKVDSSWYVAYR